MDELKCRWLCNNSLICEISDLIVLDLYGPSDKQITSELQFGLKKKPSTNMCSRILKESIVYYINNGSAIYRTMLDATKAFDRVEYCKLFKLLI